MSSKEVKVKWKQAFTIHRQREQFCWRPRQPRLADLTTIQLLRRLLCNVESNTGGIHGSNLNQHTRRRVRDVPAPAAIRRVPHYVKSTPNEEKVRDVAESRESRSQTVGPVRACDIVERASPVVESSVVCGAQQRWCVGLRVFIVGLAVIGL